MQQAGLWDGVKGYVPCPAEIFGRCGFSGEANVTRRDRWTGTDGEKSELKRWRCGAGQSEGEQRRRMSRWRRCRACGLAMGFTKKFPMRALGGAQACRAASEIHAPRTAIFGMSTSTVDQIQSAHAGFSLRRASGAEGCGTEPPSSSTASSQSSADSWALLCASSSVSAAE